MVSHGGGAHQGLSGAQLHHQQAQARALEMEQAKRRSMKPTDKTIPKAVEEIVGFASIYGEMREVERRLDAAIMRKRLDVIDAANKHTKVRFFHNSATKALFTG